MPEITTCPSIPGVITTFMTPRPLTGSPNARRGGGPPARVAPRPGIPAPSSGSRGRSALVPGRRREPRLAVRQVVRPDDHLLAVLPLEQDHLVSDLEAVLVDLVVPEHRPRLHREERVTQLVRVERARLLDRLRVERAARVARGRVVARLLPELLLVRLEELRGARVREHALPLGRAVDVLRRLLE